MNGAKDRCSYEQDDKEHPQEGRPVAEHAPEGVTPEAPARADLDATAGGDGGSGHQAYLIRGLRNA